MPDADLLAWADAQPRTGAFGINPAVTTEGVPAVGWYHGFLEVNQSGRRITLTESSGQYRTWTNCTNSNQWTEWKPLSTATPPQEFDLPLADGITALQPCTYYKNRLGEVTVGGAVAGTISQDTIIGTLPVGYRPSKVIERPATIGTGSVRYPGSVFVNPYGVITITTPASEMAAVFEASFIAED